MHSCPVGIAEHTTLFGIVVAPNPVHDMLNVQFTSPCANGTTFELFDTRGLRVMVRRTDALTQLQIDCSELAAGIYYYRVSMPGQGSTGGKIAVE